MSNPFKDIIISNKYVTSYSTDTELTDKLGNVLKSIEGINDTSVDKFKIEFRASLRKQIDKKVRSQFMPKVAKSINSVTPVAQRDIHTILTTGKVPTFHGNSNAGKSLRAKLDILDLEESPSTERVTKWLVSNWGGNWYKYKAASSNINTSIKSSTNVKVLSKEDGLHLKHAAGREAKYSMPFALTGILAENVAKSTSVEVVNAGEASRANTYKLVSKLEFDPGKMTPQAKHTWNVSKKKYRQFIIQGTSQLLSEYLYKALENEFNQR